MKPIKPLKRSDLKPGMVLVMKNMSIAIYKEPDSYKNDNIIVHTNASRYLFGSVPIEQVQGIVGQVDMKKFISTGVW
jgi:hypothetical protein